MLCYSQPRAPPAATVHTYPSHSRPVLVQRRQAGCVSSHLTLRILLASSATLSLHLRIQYKPACCTTCLDSNSVLLFQSAEFACVHGGVRGKVEETYASATDCSLGHVTMGRREACMGFGELDCGSDLAQLAGEYETSVWLVRGSQPPRDVRSKNDNTDENV